MLYFNYAMHSYIVLFTLAMAKKDTAILCLCVLNFPIVQVISFCFRNLFLVLLGTFHMFLLAFRILHLPYILFWLLP